MDGFLVWKVDYTHWKMKTALSEIIFQIDVDSLYESMSKWGAGVGDGILADAIQDTPVVIQECP